MFRLNPLTEKRSLHSCNMICYVENRSIRQLSYECRNRTIKEETGNCANKKRMKKFWKEFKNGPSIKAEWMR
jgi:hypothetical protein